MSKIHIPYLELVEIEYEFIILENQLEMIEEQIDFLTEKKQHTHKAKLLAMNYFPDDPDWQNEKQEHYEFVDYVLPRIYRNTYIVALWGGFESAIVELSRLCNQKENYNYKDIFDLKGDFFNRAENFFKKVFDIQLFKTGTQREKIKQLYSVRNAIAHASGRLEALENGNLKKINKLIGSNLGIDVYHGKIIVSKDFIKEAFNEIRKVIDYLFSEYKETYK